MAFPKGHLLRIIRDIEAAFCEPVEVRKVKHTKELCHLYPQRRALRVRLDDSYYQSLEFSRLELVADLTDQQLMVHEWKVMMDVKCEMIFQFPL